MKKLVKAIVKNFEGIKSATLDLTSPVTLLIGTNNQGKSSLLDAIDFGFTGKARAVSKFKDVGELLRGGAADKSLSVQIDYLADDETECSLGRTVKNASKNIDPDEVLPFCLNPQAFVLLSSKERGKILSSLTSSGLEELIEESISEHIGDFPKEVISEIKVSGADVCDVDALRECVVEVRRKSKRDVAGLRTEEPTLTEFDLPADFVIDIVEDKINELDRRIKKGTSIILKAAELNFANGTLLDLRKKEAATRQELDTMPAAKKQDRDSLEIEQTEAIITLAEMALNSDRNECPLCKSKENFSVIVEAADKATAWLAEQAETIERAKTIATLQATLERQGAQVDEARQKVESLGAAELPKNAENLLKKYTDERDKLKESVFEYRKFQNVSRETTANIEIESALNELIERCNEIDDALKDGGAVKTDIAEGGRDLPINVDLLEAWNMPSLTLADNGELTYSDRAIEHASASEKYRAGCLLGCALAELADVGFAIIDGFDILDDENKNALISYIGESGLNNVIVGYTIGNEGEIPKGFPDDVTAYLVKSGTAEKI